MPVCNEYQHFIPQFLIKNYSYPFKCPEAEKAGKKKCKCKHEKGKYPNDLVINCVNLRTTPFSIETRSIKRVFGSPGMYFDPNKQTTHEQRRIESMFSKLESHASSIFRRIVKSHEAQDTAISLTRLERDEIRKFFFLLKYRGSGFRRRFYHETANDYSDNDRDRFLEYMKNYGFSAPRDVWYHNLEIIMNLEMDPQGEWKQALPRKMFPDDAMWFIAHVDLFYMAICTPADMKEEFILTDNCYNTFEGPNTFMKDENTGQIHGSYHASFHEFATISPRLLIVLRSLTLPNPREDSNPAVKKWRQELHYSAIESIFGSECKSLLHDLPIQKARNSYSQIIGGFILPTAGFDGEFRRDDKFTFQYHPLNSRHVRIMNNLFLENADRSETFAFKDKEAFLAILESYISGPCKSFKIVGGLAKEARHKYLQGLETLAKKMGSQKTLLWMEMPEPRITDSVRFMEKTLAFHRLVDIPDVTSSEQNPEFKIFELYSKLRKKSEPKSHFDEDLAQAGKMVELQAAVILWNLGSSSTSQIRLQLTLHCMFHASHCARYWIYLKLWRKHLFGDGIVTQDIVDLMADAAVRDGPEDAFAKTAHLYDCDTLNILMHISTRHDSTLRKYQTESIWSKLSGGSKNIDEHLTIEDALFLTANRIKDCGIRKIEILAEWEERKLLQVLNPQLLSSYPSLDSDTKLELMVRIHVRDKFQAAMLGELESEVLEDLARVFFALTFPTPPVQGFLQSLGQPIYVQGRPEAVPYQSTTA